MRTYTIRSQKPQQTEKPSDPSGLAGWGMTPSTLDDARDLLDLYHRLAALGFLSHQELTCRLGDLRLYSRQSKAGMSRFPFEYCCILYIGGLGNPILLRDLPDVLGLLTEIDARPKSVGGGDLDALTELKEAFSLLTERLDDPFRDMVNFAELKTPLVQGVALLKEIKASLLGNKNLPEIESLPLSVHSKNHTPRKNS